LGPCAGRPNFKHLFWCFRVVKEITGLSRGFLPLIYSGNKKTFRRPNSVKQMGIKQVRSKRIKVIYSGPIERCDPALKEVLGNL